jgi:hypothetical protein
MDELPPALPHGQLEEVFPDVFFVTGMMKTLLMNADWQFSRSMTVVREGNALTLLNAIRLNDAGLAQLKSLGRVTNVVNIASLHGRDIAFYKGRYDATFWALPRMENEHGLTTDKELTPDGEMPFAGCSLFEFRATKRPEGILHIDRAGGILISGDSLQNYLAPDEYFSDDSRKKMTEMGFFQYGNYGPLWMQLNEPQAEDFVRLFELPFEHLLPGHGSVLRNWAKEAFAARFLRVFGSSPVGMPAT